MRVPCDFDNRQLTSGRYRHRCRRCRVTFTSDRPVAMRWCDNPENVAGFRRKRRVEKGQRMKGG